MFFDGSLELSHVGGMFGSHFLVVKV
jgi:hypothetical protein